MIELLLYFFSGLLLVSALTAVIAQNTVYSVLLVLLAFLSASFILFLLEAEFLALLFLTIYIGAVVILFLFVVMMLNLKFVELKKNFFKYFPFGIFTGSLFLIEIIFVISKNFTSNPYNGGFFSNFFINWFDKLDYITEIEAVGQVLYTHYVVQFLIAGLILLVAVICAVILTLNSYKRVRSQAVFKQLSRNYKNAVLYKNS